MSTTKRKPTTGKKRSSKKSSRKPKVKLSLKSVAILSLSIIAGCALVLAGGTFFAQKQSGVLVQNVDLPVDKEVSGTETSVALTKSDEKKSVDKVSSDKDSSKKSDKKDRDAENVEVIQQPLVDETEETPVISLVEEDEFLSGYDVSGVVVAGKDDSDDTPGVVYGSGSDFDGASLISSIDAALGFESGNSAPASTEKTTAATTQPASTTKTTTTSTQPASTSKTTATTTQPASTTKTTSTTTQPASTTRTTAATTQPASTTKTTTTTTQPASTTKTTATTTQPASTTKTTATATQQTPNTKTTAAATQTPSSSKTTTQTQTLNTVTTTATVGITKPAVDLTKCPYDIPQATKGATLVFVIDDAGQTLDNLKQYVSLPFPITIAVLPKLKYTREAASTIIAYGKEMILHQPMQASNMNIKPGPGAITPDMSVQEIQKTVRENLDELGPGVKGMNNHEGSMITENLVKIQSVLEVAQERHVYFLDSRTTAKTVAVQAGLELGMQVNQRDVFIDDIINREEMLKQIYRGLSIANKNGKVIMIGHVDKSVKILPALLQDMYPYLVAKGYKFATPSTL